MFLGHLIFHRKKENGQKDIVGIFFHVRLWGIAYDSGQFRSLRLVYGRKGKAESGHAHFVFVWHWSNYRYFSHLKELFIKAYVRSLSPLFPSAPALANCITSQNASSNFSCSLIFSSLNMSLIGVCGPKGNMLPWLDSTSNIRIVLASECDPFSSRSSSLSAANFSRVLFPDIALCQYLKAWVQATNSCGCCPNSPRMPIFEALFASHSQVFAEFQPG